MTAENGKLDKIPPRRLQELLLPAEGVNRLTAAVVAGVAKWNDKHFVFGDPLAVQVDDVMMLLSAPPADAIRVFQRKPVPIAFLGGVHAKRECRR
jgi:bifunctional DNase/RNase